MSKKEKTIEDYLIFDEDLDAEIDTLAWQYYDDDNFNYLLDVPFEEMRDTMARDIFRDLQGKLISNVDFKTAHDYRLYETVRCRIHCFLTETCGYKQGDDD